MKCLLCLFALLFTLVPRIIAGEPKPNNLTAKEIADGWILLFDGEKTFGWHAPDDSQWTIEDGILAHQKGKPGFLMTNTVFGDYHLKLEYQAPEQVQLLVGCAHDAQPWIYDKDENMLRRPRPIAGPLEHVRFLYATRKSWGRATLTVEGGKITKDSVQAEGRSEESKGPSPDLRSRHAGQIALSGTNIAVRNIKLKPLDLKPIFNGKDLSGWKEFPGKKSKFSVTPEGWLNIKNGPGDLQTEGQYSDFILQLECINNGEHLNSGVFFRCRPGEYQQGYEAQIRNQFTAEPTQEYTLEVFDEKTGELKEKKKVKSTAVDYGTGGIYRRYPARKEVAKDHEWFAMTIIARGRHIAVWVNGIQVTDWTDTRPIKDNARNGCRLEKGPISLQGHDPTTDLSFRNIRIAELPKDK